MYAVECREGIMPSTGSTGLRRTHMNTAPQVSASRTTRCVHSWGSIKTMACEKFDDEVHNRIEQCRKLCSVSNESYALASYFQYPCECLLNWLGLLCNFSEMCNLLI